MFEVVPPPHFFFIRCVHFDPFSITLGRLKYLRKKRERNSPFFFFDGGMASIAQQRATTKMFRSSTASGHLEVANGLEAKKSAAARARRKGEKNEDSFYGELATRKIFKKKNKRT